LDDEFLGCLILIFCSNFGILYAAPFWRGINLRPTKPDLCSHFLSAPQEAVAQIFDQLLDASRHAENREAGVSIKEQCRQVEL
jgi:hypothetical protein